MSEPTKAKKGIDPLSTVAIVVVLIILGVNIWNAKHANAPEVIPPLVTNEPLKDASGNPLPTKTVISEFISPSAFEHVAKAEQTINQTQGKTGATGDLEQIVYGIVEDPSKPNTVYFATSSNNPENNFVGIYRYNTVTRQWNRLFKQTYAKDESGVRRLHVVGIDGEEAPETLIITEDRLGDLLDPCASPLLTSPKLFSLSLIEANDGLREFALSPESAEYAGQMETNCRAE